MKMHDHTDEAIKAKVEEIWRVRPHDWRELEIKIERDGLAVRLTLTSMYDAPPYNYEIASQLAEFFGTTDINNADHIDAPGCDTCDYGSSYGFTLVIQPERIKL